jgi:hypothetical protein
LPEAPAFWSMLASPPETWSFARLQQDIRFPPATPAGSAARPILAALEAFDLASEDQRHRREVEFEAALSEKDASLAARGGDVARLEAELSATRSQIGGMERALADASGREAALDRALSTATEREAALYRALSTVTEREAALYRALSNTTEREAALGRHVAAIHRSTSWRITAPLRAMRRCFDALMRGFKAR